MMWFITRTFMPMKEKVKSLVCKKVTMTTDWEGLRLAIIAAS